MIVQVSYRVPIEAVIDTEAKSVIRVVVLDEEIKLEHDDLAKDGKSIHTSDMDPITDPAIRAAAMMIAEHHSWPAWEFGW